MKLLVGPTFVKSHDQLKGANKGMRRSPKMCQENTPPKTNMTMDNLPFEDVFTIENGDFPMSC